jgi:hypothetical protein
MIAMPCAHGLVKMGAMTTALDAGLSMMAAGYDVATNANAMSDVVMARNRLASSALNRGCSHILFIDSDMNFPGSLVMTMLKADKDVIGLVYPRREINLDRLIEVSRASPELSPEDVVSNVMHYIVRLEKGAAFTKGMGRVAGLGMGGTLIRVSVLQTMLDENLAQHRPDHQAKGSKNKVWGFFDPLSTKAGVQLSEDYSFCARWTGRGGEVWAYVASGVKHTGDFDYTGNLGATQTRTSD